MTGSRGTLRRPASFCCPHSPQIHSHLLLRCPCLAWWNGPWLCSSSEGIHSRPIQSSARKRSCRLLRNVPAEWSWGLGRNGRSWPISWSWECRSLLRRLWGVKPGRRLREWEAVGDRSVGNCPLGEWAAGMLLGCLLLMALGGTIGRICNKENYGQKYQKDLSSGFLWQSLGVVNVWLHLLGWLNRGSNSLSPNTSVK